MRADASRGGLELVAAPLRMWQQVPEPLLPRWPLPEKGALQVPVWPEEPWSVRLVGREAGSAWVVVEPGRTSTALTAVPARWHQLLAVTPGPTKNLKAEVYLPVPNAATGPRLQALFVGNPEGRLELPAWPADTELYLVVSAEELAPAVLPGGTALPPTVSLAPGAAVSGTVRKAEGEPVSPAGVMIETWTAPKVPIPFRRTGEVDAAGNFLLRGLPPGEATLVVAVKGFGVMRRSLALREGEVLSEVVELARTKPVRVRVVDTSGSPVAKALVRSNLLFAVTDAEGMATLRGLDPANAHSLTVSAPGFLERVHTLAPPLPEETAVQLEAGLVVRGTLVDVQGNVVTDAEVLLRTGCEATSSTPVPAAAGRFEATVNPASPGQLVVRSPSSLEVAVDLQPGQAGEERDLGPITLPAGAVVTGRVVAEEDQTPLAGARVSTLRSSDMGAVVAAALGNVVATTTGADGSFRLAGLRPGPVHVHVAAPGYAPMSVLVTPSEAGEHEAGTISLSLGATVRVRTRLPRGVEEAAVWLEPSSLPGVLGRMSAPVLDGEAMLEHVPRGPAGLSVVAEGAVVCERQVRIPERGQLRVDCPASVVQVRGTVRFGDEPAGSGVLTFARPSRQEGPEAIVTTLSPTGLRQQESHSSRPRPVSVPTRADGSFGPQPLPAGTWEVTFAPTGAGTVSPARSVQVPGAAEAKLEIVLPSVAVAGLVLDGEGQPVAAARVTTTTGGPTALAGADGRFVLVGVDEGRVGLQARLGERVSEPVWVEVRAGRRTEPVELRLLPPEAAPISVAVEAERGLQAAGATLLLELEGRGTRFATVGADGRVVVKVARPFPPRVRAVVWNGSSLAIGEWTPWEAAVKSEVRVRLGPGGGLVIAGASATALHVVSESAGELTFLLRQLGILQVVPEGTPLVVWPLPPGSYLVSTETATCRAEVRAGEQAHVSCR